MSGIEFVFGLTKPTLLGSRRIDCLDSRLHGRPDGRLEVVQAAVWTAIQRAVSTNVAMAVWTAF